MQICSFKVTGISPLLQHSPSSMAVTDDKQAKAKKIPKPEDEAKAGVYFDEEGEIVHPTVAFRNALISGGKNRKFGKFAVTSLFRGNVFYTDEYVKLVNPESGEPLTKWDIYTKRVVIGKSGVLRSRPRFPKWGGEVFFDYDEEILNEDQIFQIFQIAGKSIGVGDFRPERGGIFGRFTVEKT